MTNPTLNIFIRPNARRTRVQVELNAAKFEQFAAHLGLFRPEFLKSLARAERDITEKKLRRLRALRDLRCA